MRRSVYNEVMAKPALTSAALTDGTANGTTIDRGENLNNTRSAMLLVYTGTVTDGSHAVSIQDSDDGSSWAAAATEHVQGDAVTLVAADDNVVREVGYTGPKRYLRVSITTSGATTGGVIGAVMLLGYPRRTPIDRS